MYEEYFSLSSPPFRLAPDTRFFYGSRSHNKAMAYLHYGLRQAEGFIVITGSIGAGKSMLISHLLEQLNRSNVVAAHLLTPNLKPDALVAHVLSAFGVEPAGAGKTAEIEAFEDYLFDQMNRGRRVLLIVDEAQNLPAETLEELRILSNMDYQGTPLFQVFLVGQPDFRDIIARKDMEQLRQRVIAAYHLEAMTREETEGYIRHRLTVAGWAGNPSIATDAFDLVHQSTGGLPRKINKLCTRMFLTAALEKRSHIDRALAETAIADLESEHKSVLSATQNENAATEVARKDHAVADDTPALLPAAVVAERTPEATRESPPAEMRAAMTRDEAPTAPATLFDRLKAAKARPAVTEAAPTPATLGDVAQAIAAVSDRNLVAEPANEAEAQEAAQEAPQSAEPPPFIDQGGGAETWRRAVVASIVETQDELKVARKSVAKIRRRLSDIESERKLNRTRLVTALDRAQAIIAETGDARS